MIKRNTNHITSASDIKYDVIEMNYLFIYLLVKWDRITRSQGSDVNCNSRYYFVKVLKRDAWGVLNIIAWYTRTLFRQTESLVF